MNRLYQTIKELSSILSVSGAEESMAAYLTKRMEGLCDDVRVDAMGNVLCKKDFGCAETVLLTAHMDEIGFLVCDADENGFLLLAPVGGIHAEAAAFSRVRFENGTLGVLVPSDGTKAADLDAKQFACDIGAKNRASALRRVKIGDRCATLAPAVRLSSRIISGRALDNRLGVATLLAVAEAMQEKQSAYNLIFAFTVQEEVGLRGAAPAAYAAEPDYCINVDITPAHDGYGAKGAVKLGKGPTVKYKDRSVVCNRRMIDHLNRCAAEHAIPVQAEILTFGGTDTGPVQSSRAGVVSGAVSIPLRYVHTDCETAALSDTLQAAELVSAALCTPIR